MSDPSEVFLVIKSFPSSNMGPEEELKERMELKR